MFKFSMSSHKLRSWSIFNWENWASTTAVLPKKEMVGFFLSLVVWKLLGSLYSHLFLTSIISVLWYLVCVSHSINICQQKKTGDRDMQITLLVDQMTGVYIHVFRCGV